MLQFSLAEFFLDKLEVGPTAFFHLDVFQQEAWMKCRDQRGVVKVVDFTSKPEKGLVVSGKTS